MKTSEQPTTEANNHPAPTGVVSGVLVRCRDCAALERGKWVKEIHGFEGDQCGGNCRVLLAMLQMDNASMALFERIYIQDSFGCVFGKLKAPNDGTHATRPNDRTERRTAPEATREPAAEAQTDSAQGRPLQ